jgi:hypothetical protein
MPLNDSAESAGAFSAQPPQRKTSPRASLGHGRHPPCAPIAAASARHCERRGPSGLKARQGLVSLRAYSITSSARASRAGGMSRPSVLAVLRLMTNSYLVGACTGRSAGFSPLRMRST